VRERERERERERKRERERERERVLHIRPFPTWKMTDRSNSEWEEDVIYGTGYTGRGSSKHSPMVVTRKQATHSEINMRYLCNHYWK
jgi:hypothetical protein